MSSNYEIYFSQGFVFFLRRPIRETQAVLDDRENAVYVPDSVLVAGYRGIFFIRFLVLSWFDRGDRMIFWKYLYTHYLCNKSVDYFICMQLVAFVNQYL
jgi:hypothetical protein